jgi:pseudouridine synthase
MARNRPGQSGRNRKPKSPSQRRHGKQDDREQGKVRIHKVLSRRGLASRRDVEQMLEEGRIRVNGKMVTEHPCFVDPDRDEIEVDGAVVRMKKVRPVYYLLNKPKNVVCTARDELGRTRAVDLVGPIPQRVFCVGRLDAESTGLLLLTNDGQLSQHLTHPSHEVAKTYIVTVDGEVDGEAIERIKKGIYLDGQKTGGAGVKVLRRSGRATLLEITLREGRNREIRRMLARQGHKVRKLKRVAIGPITDRGLGVGNVRELSSAEVKKLYRAGQ